MKLMMDDYQATHQSVHNVQRIAAKREQIVKIIEEIPRIRFLEIVRKTGIMTQ